MQECHTSYSNSSPLAGNTNSANEAVRENLDSSCSVVVTADEAFRGAKTIPLKAIMDDALRGVDCVKKSTNGWRP